MSKIHLLNQPKPKLKMDSMVQIPASCLPSFRTQVAIQNETHRNILIRTWGGLGDIVCSEPAVRFALKTFKNCDISMISDQPTLFKHLKFKDVFQRGKDQVDFTKYFNFATIQPEGAIEWEFMSHMIVNCVDYPSLCAFRCMLPIEEKDIRMQAAHDFAKIDSDTYDKVDDLMVERKLVLVHAGAHWQSKTFPVSFWNTVLKTLIDGGATPVLIGAQAYGANGTVELDPTGCIDLRNLTSIDDLLYLCQRATVVLTNDSSPLHMAASSDAQYPVTGKAWIGFIATCKHPDMISHWRRNPFTGKNEWAWREVNHSIDGYWNHTDYLPNKEVNAENIGDLLLQFLPKPEVFGAWALEKLKQGVGENAI